MNGDNNNNSNDDDDDDYDDGEKITQTNINILLLYFVLLLTNLILWDVFWLPFSWHACAMVSLFSRTQTIRSIQIRNCTTHVTVIYMYIELLSRTVGVSGSISVDFPRSIFLHAMPTFFLAYATAG